MNPFTAYFQTTLYIMNATNRITSFGYQRWSHIQGILSFSAYVLGQFFKFSLGLPLGLVIGIGSFVVTLFKNFSNSNPEAGENFKPILREVKI